MSAIVKMLILNNFCHVTEPFHQSIYFCVCHTLSEHQWKVHHMTVGLKTLPRV